MQTPDELINHHKLDKLKILSFYTNSSLGCGCGCAGHSTYFLIHDNDLIYEYHFSAKLEENSCNEYFYDLSKPTTKKLPILTLYEFYNKLQDSDTNEILDILYEDDQHQKRMFYYKDSVSDFVELYINYSKKLIDKLTYYQISNLNNETIKNILQNDSLQLAQIILTIISNTSEESIIMSKYLIINDLENDINQKNKNYYFN
jgi:hypothetical protein